jgi:hypothetical protein
MAERIGSPTPQPGNGTRSDLRTPPGALRCFRVAATTRQVSCLRPVPEGHAVFVAAYFTLGLYVRTINDFVCLLGISWQKTVGTCGLCGPW